MTRARRGDRDRLALVRQYTAIGGPAKRLFIYTARGGFVFVTARREEEVMGYDIHTGVRDDDDDPRGRVIRRWVYIGMEYFCFFFFFVGGRGP